MASEPAKTLKVVLLGNSGVGKTCLRSQFVHHMFTNAYKATIGGDYLTSKVTVAVPQAQGAESAAAKTDAVTVAVSANSGSGSGTGSGSGSGFGSGSSSGPLGGGGSGGSVSGAAAGSPATQLAAEQEVNLQIWDTAGQERFNSISQAFYRGTDVVVLVYDVTNYESVVAINGWFTRFMEHCHVDRPGVVIVGNKTDKESVISREDVYRLLEINSDGGPSVHSFIDRDSDDGCGGILEISSKRLESVDKVFQRVAELGVRVASSDGVGRNRLVGFDIDLSQGERAASSGCC